MTQEEYDILSTSVIDATLQASEKSETDTNLSKQHAEVTEQLAVLKSQLAKKETEYSLQLQEIESAKEKLHEFEKVNSQLQNELDSYRKEVTTVQLSLKEKDTEFKKTLQEKQEELTNCQSNFEHAREQIMILQEQLEGKNTMTQKLEKDVSLLQEALEQAHITNTSQNDEIEKLKIELNNNVTCVGQLEQELRESSARHQATKEDELRKLQEDMERKLSVEQELKSLQESCEQHQSMLSSREEELNTTKGQLEHKDVIIEEMQQTILSLQNSLKEGQLTKDDEIRKLNEEVEMRCEDLVTMQKSLAEYRMQLETSKLEHESLKGQAAEVSRDKELLIQQLKSNISGLEKKLSSSEEKVQSELQ